MYMGFNKLKAKLAAKGLKNPAGAVAAIGRNKYGAEKYNRAAHEGKSMEHVKPKKSYE